MGMSIGAICNREVITVQSDASVQHAASLMRHYHVGDVLVVKEHEGKSVPVGIVTDRDIVIEVIATALDATVITTGDIMAATLFVIEEGAGILEAVQSMTAKGVRRLPVVDTDGGLVGLITLDDLLFLLARELGALSKLVTREQKNELTKRR
jgi:CBS domain-containing protein